MDLKPMDKVLIAAGAVGFLSVGMLYRALNKLAMTTEKLKAKDEIRETTRIYARGVDRKDPDLIESAFTEDALLDIPNMKATVSRKVFAFEAAKYLRTNTVATEHVVTNHLIRISDDLETATSEAYFVAYHWKNIDGEIKDAGASGRYLDKWRRCPDGKYKIVRRKILYDMADALWNSGMLKAATEGKNVVLCATKPELIGQPGRHDASYEHFQGIFP